MADTTRKMEAIVNFILTSWDFFDWISFDWIFWICIGDFTTNLNVCRADLPSGGRIFCRRRRSLFKNNYDKCLCRGDVGISETFQLAISIVADADD